MACFGREENENSSSVHLGRRLLVQDVQHPFHVVL